MIAVDVDNARRFVIVRNREGQEEDEVHCLDDRRRRTRLSSHGDQPCQDDVTSTCDNARLSRLLSCAP